MLKILWKRGEIAPEEQFSSLIHNILLPDVTVDFYVKANFSFSLRDKRLFEIIEGEITMSTVCQYKNQHFEQKPTIYNVDSALLWAPRRTITWGCQNQVRFAIKIEITSGIGPRNIGKTNLNFQAQIQVDPYSTFFVRKMI